MKNILVTAASGIIGYGILRSLRQSTSELNLIGTTIYPDSVAPGFCDIFELAPPTGSKEYINWLTDIIKKHQVDLIIPGMEDDIYKWAEHAGEIEAAGAKMAINNTRLINFCKDKWGFYEELMKAESPYAIDTSLNNDFDYLLNRFGLPFILKPKRGHGSKGIVRVHNQEAFFKHKHDVGSVLMAQPIVGNEEEEYTTAVFGDGDGGYYAQITLRRKLSGQGYTDKAEVVQLQGMDQLLTLLCNYFKPLGPTNFQVRVHNNILKLLEINPRISSSTSIRTAFGYNEADMLVNYYLENKKPVQPIIKQGHAIRYIEDLIFYK